MVSQWTSHPTAGQVTKQTPLRADFERKADAPQRRQPRSHRYNDYEDDESSVPEFHFPERHGKHRLMPVRRSRIADRPVSDKDSIIKIEIEFGLEVEVEIYAGVKGDITIGLLKTVILAYCGVYALGRRRNPQRRNPILSGFGMDPLWSYVIEHVNYSRY
jgi:hypothetical protein